MASPFLKKPDTNKERHHAKGSGVFNDVEFALSSMQGWRTSQEDAHCHVFPSNKSQNLGFVGIFDGHAGPTAAKWTAANIINFIENAESFKFVTKPDSNEIVVEALARSAMEGFFNCDESLKSLPDFKSGKDVSGCTGVVCIVTEKNLIVSNTGDSRCVLVRDGEPIFATRDHKPDDEREADRVRQAGGNVMYGRINGDLASARSFGDFRYKKDATKPPSQQIVTVMPDLAMMDRNSADEILILACDGIWDVMSNYECAQFVLAAMRLGASVQLAADLVLEECLRKSSGDNMSCIVVALDSCPRPGKSASPNLEQVRHEMLNGAL